jgi:hypothetical protein
MKAAGSMAGDERGEWSGFVRRFAVAAVTLMVALYGFVLLMDPFGLHASPARAPTPIMDVNQRFMYPQLVRHAEFDSAVLGTSTVRLLDPARLSAALGGRFINLGMNAATPWEQMQLLGLLLRSVPQPRNLILGLDRTWCDENAEKEKVTFRAFPPWLYDDNRWNDYPELVNLTSLEIAGRVFLHRLGLMPERLPANGFEVFVPDESDYDLARARYNLAQWRQEEPPAKPYLLTPKRARRLSFPALAWLDESLKAVPQSTTISLLFTPSHMRAQPVPGSRDAARDLECKSRIAVIAKQHGATLVDFRIASPVTTDDANYWDPLHFRIGIAQRIVDALKTARETGADAADGFYKVLSPRRP